MRIIEGCLIEAFKRGEVDVLAHQVNCQGKMNSGIAKAIREEWPEHYEDYMSECERHNNFKLTPLGTEVYTDVSTPKGTGRIVGLFSQDRYGYDGQRYTNYNALALSLYHTCLQAERGSLIGIPFKLGCDRGGGNWDFVSELITDTEKRFRGLEFVAYKKV